MPVSLANCLAISATFLKGRTDSLTGHTGLSDGTLFPVPVSLASSGQMFKFGDVGYFSLRDVGTLLRDIFMCPAKRDTFSRPDVLCATLLYLPGQIFALEQCQERFSGTHVCRD